MRASRQETDVPQLMQMVVAFGPGAPSIDQKVRMLESLRGISREAGEAADRQLLERIASQDGALAEVGHTQAQLKAMLETLTAPPLYPAMLLESAPGSQRAALVVQAGSARAVTCAPEVDPASLRAGDEVLLSHDLNTIVSRSPYRSFPCGETALFDREAAGGRIVVKHREEEIVLARAAALEEAALRPGDRVRWDRHSYMALEVLPRATGDGLFLAEPPKATFADIGGLAREIERMQRSIRLRVFHPEIVRKYGLPPLGAILLIGAPGTGKTMMAGALAHWLGEISGSGRSLFMNIKPAALHSMWYAQTEANYREAFQFAREASQAEPLVPVVIFFDEVDSVSATRGRSLMRVDDRVVQAFGAELDGLTARGNILVVGATNRRDAMDPALLRPGRFGDCVIEVPRPNTRAAREILGKHLTGGMPYAGERMEVIDAAISTLYAPNGSADVAEIMLRNGARRAVKARDLMSGASLQKIARVAVERACLRELESGQVGIRVEDVLEGIGEELEALTGVLTPANCRDHLAGLPQDVEVAGIEPARKTAPRARRYLNVA